MTMKPVTVEELDSCFRLPTQGTTGSAGYDLYAAIDGRMVIQNDQWSLIPCGIKMAIPQGYEGQIRPRSGLALKHGVTVLNGPGTIDSDYRGEIAVMLINHGAGAFTVERGLRVGQIVFAKHETATFTIAKLDETSRGEGGFGSTGQ